MSSIVTTQYVVGFPDHKDFNVYEENVYYELTGKYRLGLFKADRNSQMVLKTVWLKTVCNGGHMLPEPIFKDLHKRGVERCAFC